MYCTHCGVQLSDDANRYCSSCGHETLKGAEARYQGGIGYSAPRRLYRLTYDKTIAGVCSGIAKYLDVDVTLIRVLAITLIIMSGGVGLFAYIGAWILMPVEPYYPVRAGSPSTQAAA